MTRGAAHHHDLRRVPVADGAGAARIEVLFQPSPTTLNPLGVKGIGECATVPVAAAVIGAVEDALRAHGVRIAEFPLTPMRLLALIDQGRGSIPGDC